MNKGLIGFWATILGLIITIVAYVFPNNSGNDSIAHNQQIINKIDVSSVAINLTEVALSPIKPKLEVMMSVPEVERTNIKSKRSVSKSVSPLISIELSKPNTEYLSTFKKKILIEGKIVASKDETAAFSIFEKNNAVLLPVIEGNEYYTYDYISISPDGSFRASWPISVEHINGRIFWVGIFELDGIIQARERYNKSPITEAKYVSNFVYFD